MCSQIFSAISILLFGFAAWMGFIQFGSEFDEKRWENRLKKWSNEKVFKGLKFKWIREERFAITRVFLLIAIIFGIIGIFI